MGVVEVMFGYLREGLQVLVLGRCARRSTSTGPR